MENIQTSNIKNAARSGARDLSVMAMFTAIILIMAFTPFGLIDLPLIKATILHVPVIIGCVLLGPKKGAFFGFLFGLTSLFKNTMTPSLLSFAFTPAVPVPGLNHGSPWALVICFLPRILVGILPWMVYYAIEKLMGKHMNIGIRTIALAISGAVGAMTNTILVMGSIYFVFRDAYAAIKNIPVSEVLGIVLGIVFANGIPEAVVAAILVPLVTIPLLRAKCIRSSL